MRWWAIAAGCSAALLAGCFFDEHGVDWSDGGGARADARSGGDGGGGSDGGATDAGPGPDGLLPPDAQLSPDAASLDGATSLGFAVALDGKSDYVRVARQIGDDFTIEGWIRTTDSRNGNGFWQGSPLFYADVNGAPKDDFGVTILNDHLAFGVGNPDTTIESTSAVNTGAWVHVAVTRVKSTGVISVYVNGVRENSLTHQNRNSLTDPPSIDFGGNTINNRWLTGDLDEVRIWNVARSDSQIAASMNQRLTGNEAGLVGYWRLDDGSGTTATDSSSSGNDGQLQGNPTWVPSDLVLQP